MSDVLILTGSIRPHSVSSKVAALVKAAFDAQGVTAEIVEVGTLGLPFYDAATPPSAPDYHAPHEAVAAWGKRVAAAAAVVLVTPEYNHNLSGIQKNAIDWLFAEWNDKPVALVGYGWYAAANVFKAIKPVLDTVKAKQLEPAAGLGFGQQLSPAGEVTDEAAVSEQLAAVVAAVKAAI